MDERICVLRDGQPKRAYATAQEAMRQIGYGYRFEPYACPEHGWHIGTRRRANVWRLLAVACNKISHVLAILDSPKGDAASKLEIIRRIVSARDAYFDDPEHLGKHTSWPRSAVDDVAS
ncbi:MAG TPA: hypothetical protein VEV38_05075 [Candidatus Eremiobacteraceae bacterium]|nr:hypothetical protein [Candidatus Eremiobacteraceae bacterium]